jgi:hypothetical protein
MEKAFANLLGKHGILMEIKQRRQDLSKHYSQAFNY